MTCGELMSSSTYAASQINVSAETLALGRIHSASVQSLLISPETG